MAMDSHQPLYQKIFNDLLTGIRNGTWKDGARLPSEKELAEQYGVSRITSKKALEMLSDAGCILRTPGKGSFVREGAVDRAPVSAIPTGNLTHTRPMLIGLIMPDFDGTYGTGLLSGVEKAAADNGIFMILRRSYGDQKREEQSIEEVLLLGVDGIIIMPVHGEHYAPKILQLILNGFPLVFADRHLKGLNAPFVGTDNAGAAKKATDYLLNAGHRRISFLSPHYANNTAIEDRVEGFVKSHAEQGIAIDESIWLSNLTATLPGKNSEENIRHDIQTIQSLLKRKKDITCLFAAEYNIALLATQAVHANGLRIPEDIALLCFDCPSNFMNDYTFTHLRQRENEMGERAVDLLLHQVRGEGNNQSPVFLDADLVEGYSTQSSKDKQP